MAGVKTKSMPPSKMPKKQVKLTPYIEAVGRRKTSVARVRLFSKGNGGVVINDKNMVDYFPTEELRKTVEDPLKKMNLTKEFMITAKISGGGIHSQAEALRHGISRALIKFNADFRKGLKKAGFLTRDS
ncbi:MAG: 30S ribosomal protein S9, partial [Patescibacteria group bacterium]